jgi:hypothetical protein
MLHCRWTPYILQEFEDALMNDRLHETDALMQVESIVTEGIALNKVSIHNLLSGTPCQSVLGYPLIPTTITQTLTVSLPASAKMIPTTPIRTGKHSALV